MISINTKTKIIGLYVDGNKATDIANELNCSQHDVYNVINSCGAYSDNIKEMHKLNKNKENEALAYAVLQKKAKEVREAESKAVITVFNEEEG